ncbi:MAG: hydrogenase maturation nickel metallochaperone HypA [Balneolaceae bacterium]
MHELSIAMNIVDIVSEEAKKAAATEVTDLEIEVGTLSGVVIEALEFALDEAIKNSVLEQANISILEVQAFGRCNNCEKEYEMNELYELCPFCQSMDRTILKGQELLVKSLKVK